MSYSFTKLFSGLTESTVWVEPYPTRVLWVSMLSWADQHGRVFGSIPGIARRSGINLDECEAALNSFLSPDRHSRTADNEGRRIEKIDGGWRLLNYSKYREMRDAEERRDYQRKWDIDNRPKRNRTNPTNPTKPDKPDKSDQNPTKAEEEAEEEAEVRKTRKEGREARAKRFAAPSTEDVRAYVAERGLKLDVQRFIDFYESKGWMVGKNQMKDWRAAVRNWASRECERGPEVKQSWL